MKNLNSSKRFALMFFCAALFVMCVNTARAQTVWMVCTWDTSSIYKQRDGKEKFERRFYVTNLISTTQDVYVMLKIVVPQMEDACSDYLQRTVYKAATERGERIESGTLKVLKNIEDSGEDSGSANRFKLASREEIEKKRAEMIKEAQSAGREILSFNWDITDDNEEADLAKEMKRIPAAMAATSTQQTPQAQPKAGSKSKTTKH